MAFSSYDELIQHIECLKTENTHLRKELDDNSSHLSKLENDAYSMKDVLVHLQKSMQKDLESGGGESTNLVQQQQLSDQNSNDATFLNHLQNNRSNWSAFQPILSKNSDGSSLHRLSEYKTSYQDIQTLLQDLKNERVKILNEMESEEKERLWFMNQLERIKQQQNNLPLTNNYTVENEIACQALEQEACQLRLTMQQKFGSNSDMLQRYEIRMQSLQLIDKESHKLQEQTQRVFGCEQKESKEDEAEAKMDPKNNVSQQNTELNETREACVSPSNMKSSRMTTSATQTAGDSYPIDCTSSSSHLSINSENDLPSMYNGTWPLDKVALWHSGPSCIGEMSSSLLGLANQETSSVMSFTSSINSSCSRRVNTHQLGTKVEMVYSLLSMLGSHDKDEMSKTLLAMSSSQDSCVAMRQSGCMPLLIQLLYGGEKDAGNSDSCSNREVRLRASKALHNIVHAHPDDKRGRREARVLRLLEQIRDYCDNLHDAAELDSDEERNASGINNMEQHPGPAMAALMKLSFDEEHRHAMCQLGGLQAIAELIEVDYAVHGNTSDQYCVTSRRYAGMALTNLTFGDGTNKALLCSFKSFMRALVAQLHSPSEDLRQVVASVLRNLSWRADPASKKILHGVGAVTTLIKAAMEAKKESTLKSILSALWNLSAHCSMNKADICAVDGALAFLVSTLTYKSASKTLSIVENGGGILRNISSQIAVHEDYRAILRQHNCLQTLLDHLRSTSLTIVSNACGTLWNLSARCANDQQTLWEMGAVSMLRNLVHSKHKMISMGSSAALKNLLAARPQGMALAAATSVDGQGKANVPSLLVRKQRALEAEIDQNLSETCDNIDSPKSSPTHRIDANCRYGMTDHTGPNPLFSRVFSNGRMYHSVDGHPLKYVCRSDSKDSIVSAHSEMMFNQMEECELHKHSTIGSQQDGWQQDTSEGFCNNLGKAGLTSQESSRIAQVMQEVVRQVALEDNLSNSLERKFTYPNGDKNLLDVNSLASHQLVCESNPCKPSNARSPSIYDKYSNFSSKIDSRNANEFMNQEQHEKCNSKYSDDGDAVIDVGVLKLDNKTCDKQQKDNIQQEALKQQPKQTNVQWQGINGAGNSYVMKKTFKNQGEKAKPTFSNYDEVETENADQPTNYSLRYTEHNDTMDKFSAPAPKAVYYPASFGDKKPSVNDDTLTTYCTEGTPLNFSTATSLSDLREIASKERPQDIQEESTTVQNLKSGCSYPNEALGSDKPVSFCVEGTPVSFSRVSSLSSLQSGEVHDDDSMDKTHNQTVYEQNDLKSADDDATLMENDVGEKLTEQQANEAKVSAEAKEVKSVSFGEGNVAEETPLMFSRCSSLGSLSSFDQHSIHDDRSSVISDFSRRASGVISPSDLPDSPGQTMPPSPKRSKANIDFTSKQHPEQKPVSEDLFADVILTYATEDTPNGFSTATSLSSLVIYDDASSTQENESPLKQIKSRDTMKFNEQIKADEVKTETCEDEELVSEDCAEDISDDMKNMSEPEENEDEILAACISSALPNNCKQNKRKYNNTKLLSKVNKLSGPPRPRASGIPIKSINVRGVRPQLNAAASLLPPTSSSRQLNDQQSSREEKEMVSCKNQAKSSKPDNNFENGPLADEDDLLAQCIQSGMPKSKLRKRINVPSDRAGGDGASTPEVSDHVSFNKPKSSLLPVSGAKSTPQRNSKNFVSCLNDTVIVYAEEGTPSNISTFSSLSDLTVDSIGDRSRSIKLTSQLRESPVGSSDHDKQPSYPESMYATDSVCHYAEEGTPVMISRHDSLSSLGIDDDSSSQQSKEKNRAHKESLLYRISGKYNTGRSRSVPSDDIVRPTNHLSLSPKNAAAQSGQNTPASSCDRPIVFQVDDTPACFSSNSSLSSLSVESLCVETSAVEQALLDECISSGMPQNKNANNGERKKGKVFRDRRKAQDIEKPVLKDGRVADPNGNNVADESHKRDLNISEADTNQKSHIDESSQEVITCAKDIEWEEKNKSCREEEEKNNFELCNPISSDVSPSSEKSSRKDECFTELSESKLLELEADQVAQEVNRQAENMPESMIQSATSLFSDLENVKPPFAMGDLMSLNGSMMSSCASESFTADNDAKARCLAEALLQACKKTGTTIPRNLDPSKLKNVPELVLRALNCNVDGLKINATPDILEVNSAMENMSMRSSYASDLLENVKPPSVLEDVDLISSTYSIASISSEVAEVPSMKGSLNSEMLFECIKPVVAMAELYAREAAVFGSMKSSCNSEFIENVNPPSILQDFTEYNSTTNDVTATLGSDTDTDNELPDDLGEPDETIVAGRESRTIMEVDEFSTIDSEIGNLEITPEVVQALQENADLVVSTLIEFKHNASNDDSSLNEDVFIECETLSLVSNESDSSRTTSENSADVILNRRPRIIKPPAFCDQQERSPSLQVDNLAAPKAVRGRRRSVTKPRQKPSSFSPLWSESPRTRDTAVKPTRTSALRASQNQQKTGVPMAANAANKKTSPPPVVVTPRLARNVASRVPVPNKSSGNDEIETDDNKPKPPVKQGTFTKDKPSQNSAPKISPTKIKQPSVMVTEKQLGDVRPPTAFPSPKRNPPLRSRMLQSRSLDDRSPSVSGSCSPQTRPGTGGDSGGRRVQSPSPMNRKVSNSLNNLKKGGNATTAMKTSPSNQSITNCRRIATNGGLRSRSASGSLNNGFRSTSNGSICSNNSNGSTASMKKVGNPPVSNLANKRQAVSKVAALWKKSGSSNDTAGKGLSKQFSDPTISRPTGLPRSSTYEKVSKLATDNDEDNPTSGLRLEEKNQVTNKTFTKSPSVDSKLGSILSHDNKQDHPGEGDSVSNCSVVSKPVTRQLVRPKTLVPFAHADGDGRKNDGKSTTASAIVAPFNYNPNAAAAVRGQPAKSLIPTPTKPTAPSAMIVKPKDTYITTVHHQPVDEPPPPPKTNTCLITTV